MGILSSLRQYRTHRRMKQFYAGLIRRGDLCMDLGANRGDRSRIFLDLGAQVVAVEPQPACQAQLQQALGHNPGFTLVPAAVGAATGSARLMLCTETDQCATLSPAFTEAFGPRSGLHWEQEIEVAVTTLDALMARYGRPAFCKIDVEGFESQVLKGLSHPIPCLSLEFNRPLLQDTRHSLTILAALGPARCNFIAYERMQFLLPQWKPLPVFLQELDRLIPEDMLTGEIFVQQDA